MSQTTTVTVKTGKLQTINGDTVETLHAETEAGVVLTADGSTVQAELDTLKAGVVHVVDAIPTDAPDGLYFVVDSEGDGDGEGEGVEL
jgi:hypothetical protein